MRISFPSHWTRGAREINNRGASAQSPRPNPERPMSRFPHLRLPHLACIVLALVAPARAVTIGGPFTLTAPDGATVTERTYRGKWLLVYFGFTFCPNVCPTTLLEIATALAKLGPDAERVQPLFITVDPQRDSREVVKAYTESFDARILGLTGTPDQIAAVTREYGAYAVVHRTGPGPDDYVIDHSSYVYLMDPQGRFVRGFEAETPGEQLAEALRPFLSSTD
jgi:protein SCO1/2